MGYRLKKNLPLAKTESKIEIENGMIYVCRNDGILYDIGTENDLAELISEGWIEEVKSREWYEIEIETTEGEWVGNGIRYKNDKEARVVACAVPGNARFIKVREVIE